jgi:hypothetical protein
MAETCDGGQRTQGQTDLGFAMLTWAWLDMPEDIELSTSDDRRGRAALEDLWDQWRESSALLLPARKSEARDGSPGSHDGCGSKSPTAHEQQGAGRGGALAVTE